MLERFSERENPTSHVAVAMAEIASELAEKAKDLRQKGKDQEAQEMEREMETKATEMLDWFGGLGLFKQNGLQKIPVAQLKPILKAPSSLRSRLVEGALQKSAPELAVSFAQDALSSIRTAVATGEAKEFQDLLKRGDDWANRRKQKSEARRARPGVLEGTKSDFSKIWIGIYSKYISAPLVILCLVAFLVLVILYLAGVI